MGPCGGAVDELHISMTQKRQSIRVALANRKLEGLTCRVDGCYNPTKNLNLLCGLHYERRRALGSALGKGMVKKSQLYDYLELAREYVQSHHDDLEVKKAVDWLERLILKSVPYANQNLSKIPIRRLYFWLAKLYYHGIDPSEILVTLIALFMHRRLDGRFYPPDRDVDAERYWRIQIATRVLMHHDHSWGGGAEYWRWRNRRPNERVSLMLAYVLLKNMGVTAKQIADRLIDEHEIRLMNEMKELQKNLR